MIIDVLTQFGVWPRRDIDISSSMLLKLMKNNSVERACTMSARGIFYDFIAGNEETLALCREGNSFIPVATLNPAVYLGCYDETKKCLDRGFKLFRFFPAIQEWSIEGLVFGKIMDILSKSGAGLLIPASEGFSKIVNVMGGMKNPVIITSFRYSHLGEAIEAIKMYPNIFVETHMINSPDFLDVLKKEVGLDRVFYGSNAPLSYMAASLKQITHSDLSKEGKEMVLGQNLEDLLTGRLKGVQEGVQP